MKPIFEGSGRDNNRFQIGLVSGVMAAGLAAGSEILQFRWTDASKKALITGVKLSVANDGTGFTAGSAIFDLIKAGAWTVNGTGGNAATLTTGEANISSPDTDTLLTSLRSASTAALGAGTKVLLANPLGLISVGVPVTAGHTLLDGVDLFLEEVDEQSPITLTTNEGFVIRATVPATGTWKFAALIKWQETK